ncbi:MAG: Eco57I restriction-modification methylase domain-containing protein [Gammaproteobacteria bacterium]|nr:Eco57I restriction-modification methylase domain-containing protein [Gammaproteobacteria bacterium]
MNREILQNIIQDFSPNKFVRFFREKNRSFAPGQEELPQYDDENFKDGLKLGEIRFTDDYLLICAFEVNQTLTEKSGKKAQYEKGKAILKGHQEYTAGIFIFYDHNGNFRFSLIYDIPLGTKRDWSAFRRFTYFVSSDPQITNKTFLQRIGDGDFSSLEKIKDAFSVEKVTKEFYADIANWYNWAVQLSAFPKDAEAEKNGRNIAVIRLITRMIFIWFMREQGLVSKNLFEERSISAILEGISPESSTYYQAILQNLFFATLNTKKNERKFRSEIRGHKGYNPDFGNQNVFRFQELFKNPDRLKDYFGEIPFLNGGLFECLDDKPNGIYIDGFTAVKKNQPEVPNILFFSGETKADLNAAYGTKSKTYKVRGLLNTLSSYNFTIDENSPDDQDIALDPELLGRVFENLLASFNPETSTTARKATGSYYTPREIVDYMVTQSLKEYFKTHLKEIDDIDNRLESLFTPASEMNPFDKSDTLRMVKLIDNLRIVDPAVGSGAFPMGILNKLVFVLARLDPENALWKETQIKAVEENVPDPIVKQKLKEQIEKQFAEKNLDYGRKLYLIQKCIYGVDIQQIAVEIAKLRFFISLLVDEKIDKQKGNWGVEPLPNLDFKIMQGNSLIEILTPEFLAGTTDQEKNDLVKQLKKAKDELFGISSPLLKDKKRKEVESLITKIIEHDKKVAIRNLQSQIAEIKGQVKLFTNRQIEEIERKKILELQQKIQAIENLKLPEATEHFEWHLNFSEVFYEKKGFDVVIANPPYVQIQKFSGKKEQKDWENQNYKTYTRTGDIYCLFYEKGNTLLRDDGNLTYITSNKWMRANYGKATRKYFVENTNPLQIIDFGGYKVFESATVDTNILILGKSANKNKANACSIGKDFKENTDIAEYLSARTIALNNLSEKSWIIASKDEQKIKEKIEKIGTPLKNWDVKIYRGIVTGFNEAFIIDTPTKERLCAEDPKSVEVLKPILRGRDIGRFYYKWVGLWVIFIPWHFPLHKDESIKGASKKAEEEFKKQYSVLYKYLLQWKSQLSDRNKDETGIRYEWYAMQRCAATYYPEFEKEKIIFQEMVQESSFMYDKDNNFYCLDTGRIITGECIEFIVSLLNSKLFFYSVKNFYGGGALGQKGIRMKHTFFENFPIPKIPESDQQPFITLVDQILSLKESDPNTDTSALEAEIDRLVYDLYGLTKEEIAIMEESVRR